MRFKRIVSIAVSAFVIGLLPAGFAAAQTGQSRANQESQSRIEELLQQIKTLQDELRRLRAELGVPQRAPEPTHTPSTPTPERKPEAESELEPPRITRSLFIDVPGIITGGLHYISMNAGTETFTVSGGGGALPPRANLAAVLTALSQLLEELRALLLARQ